MANQKAEYWALSSGPAGTTALDKCNHVPPNWETMPGAQFLELIETLRSKADSYLDTLVSNVEQQERQREL